MSQPQHISALTGIRAIAAGMVFYGHMLNGHLPDIPIFLQYGWTGVNVFFALSGYLFTYLYADRLLDGTFSWKDYIKRRLIRIYPLTTLLILVAVFSRWGEFSYEDVGLHLLLLQAWVPDYRMSLISPMWTLTVEESYYFSAPILIYYLTKLFGDRVNRYTAKSQQVSAWRLVALAMTVWIASLAFANGSTDLYQDLIMYSTAFWDSGAWTFTIFSRIVDFISGMLAATIARHVLPRRQFWGDVIVLTGMMFFWYAINTATELGGPNHVGDHRLGIFVQKGIGLSAAIVIYGLHAGGFVSRLLSTRVFVLLGEVSFALYLIQLMPFLWWPEVGMQIQYNLEDLGVNYYLAASVSYVTMNVVAVSVYYAFERPVGRFLRNRFLAVR